MDQKTPKLGAQVIDGLRRAYFSSDMHEKAVIENLHVLLSDARLFVDVGASLGQYAFHANKIMNSGKIIAIEADPQRFIELESSAGQWGGENKIQVFNYAVTDFDGSVDFFVTGSNTSGGLFPHKTKAEQSGQTVKWDPVQIRAVTLDSILADETADLIKIDVEGAELRVLKGATNILAAGRTRFLMEVDSIVDEPSGKKSPDDVFRLMESFDYKKRNFHGRYLFSRS